MGFFFSTPGEKYSNVRQSVLDLDLRRLVSRFRTDTLTQDESEKIYTALLAKKQQHKGELSLRDVYVVLHDLKNKHGISINDMSAVMKIFEEHFEKTPEWRALFLYVIDK